MSGFVKLNCSKQFLKPDGTGFFYPDELYTNGYDAYIYKFNGKYYLQKRTDWQDREHWQIVVTTNASAMQAQYSTYTELFDDWEDEYIDDVDFGPVIHGNLSLRFSMHSRQHYLFYDGSKWLLRSDKAIGLDSIWFKTFYEVDLYRRDGIYGDSPAIDFLPDSQDPYNSKTISNFKRDPYNYTYPKGYIISENSTLNGDFTAQFHADSDDPTSFDIQTIYDYLKNLYVIKYPNDTDEEASEYARFATSIHCHAMYLNLLEINIAFKNDDLYESNTLLGEYTNNSGTQTVGYLKFTDTLNNEFIKDVDFYESNGTWYVDNHELSQEPTTTQSATYTIKDDDGNDIIVTVSFDSYVADKRPTALFTTTAIKGV